MTEQDWRKTAYLKKENWPEAIPWMGPKRKYGPYPWSEPVHYNPHDVDTYIHTHPDAGSIGHYYMGDICPYCGVPLSGQEKVVTLEGEKGKLHDVTAVQDPEPCYHPDCWQDRQAEIRGQENTTLEQFK